MTSNIAPIVSVWLLSGNHRRLVQVIPSPVRDMWDEWNVRGSLLVSFSCQIILSLLGYTRKFSVNKGIDTMVWTSYLLSDWVAEFGISLISAKLGDPTDSHGKYKEDPQVLAFWATIFLVHLGGPASITAYELEDNALWLRYLVLLGIRLLKVLYIVLLAQTNSCLSYISLFMTIVGSVRCAEKAFALYSASIDVRFDTMVPPLNPNIEQSNSSIDEAENDPKKLLQNFMLLFVNLFKDVVSSYDDLQKDQLAFEELDYETAFQFVEVQLSYAYDLFYTKLSAFSRHFCFSSTYIHYATLGVLVAFGVVIIKKHELQKTDQILTCLLLVGILIFDNSFAFSNDYFRYLVGRFARSFGIQSHSDEEADIPLFTRRWSKRIHQCNLLVFCLQHNNDYVINSNKFEEFIEERHHELKEDVKKYIFKHLVKKSKLIRRGHHFSNYGVNDVIEGRGLESILGWTKMLEFHQSILTWHVATDICYYHCAHSQEGIISKIISEYMLYIMLKQRHMLPVGTGLVSFRDTCAETMKLFGQFNLEIFPSDANNLKQVCEKLLGVDLEPETRRMQSSKYVVFYASRLAGSLINLEMRNEAMWEMLNDVWVEILVYAATHCRADKHAQHLRKGGEFLTHVWLLSSHLGVMEQFQIRPTLQMGQSPQGQSTNQGTTNGRDGLGEQDIEQGHVI